MSDTWVLSLGSNLGDRIAHLAAGIRGLSACGVRVDAVSSVYETEPWGPVPQGPFCNVTVLGASEDDPAEVLQRCHAVEAAAGRVREVRWGPRTLDIDVIAVGERRASGSIELPHPRAAERAFVLVGWAEVDPAARLEGRDVVELLRLATDKVERRDDLTAHLAKLLADG